MPVAHHSDNTTAHLASFRAFSAIGATFSSGHVFASDESQVPADKSATSHDCYVTRTHLFMWQDAGNHVLPRDTDCPRNCLRSRRIVA